MAHCRGVPPVARRCRSTMVIQCAWCLEAKATEFTKELLADGTSLYSIPMREGIDLLNVANASSIVLHEVMKTHQ